jgi:putative tricarboxylic transport membrane protein
MFTTTRLTLAAFVLGASALTATGQGSSPENPECIAPAAPGGGWDFTCRQVGKSMQDQGLIEKTMQVVNLAGGGGGVAFAEVVNKRNTSDDLIVAASAATSTRLGQGAYPGNTMDQVRWLASIGADYGVIAVAADSPIADLTALLDTMKNEPASISVAGGSTVGGWDHLKVLIAATAYGIEDVRSVKYIAFDGGGEAAARR